MKKAERTFEWEVLSGRLRYLMRELGVKQKDFAKVCGVSQNYISMLVTGRRDRISEPLCRLICQTWNVNDVWLRSGAGEPFLEEEAVSAARLREELTGKIHMLDSVQLKQLLDMVD